ncbi:MAG: DUF192 domain-containing protein [bacterium]|nr:DUF192 domain-containing protein [bacterium]
MAAVVLTKVKIYSTLWSKVKGVIGESEPKGFGEGVALPGVNSIHTFFVSFPIDLVFLDKGNRITRLVDGLKPWRVSPLVFQAKTTLELKTGSIKHLGLKLGDQVKY